MTGRGTHLLAIWDLASFSLLHVCLFCLQVFVSIINFELSTLNAPTPLFISKAAPLEQCFISGYLLVDKDFAFGSFPASVLSIFSSWDPPVNLSPELRLSYKYKFMHTISKRYICLRPFSQRFFISFQFFFFSFPSLVLTSYCVGAAGQSYCHFPSVIPHRVILQLSRRTLQGTSSASFSVFTSVSDEPRSVASEATSRYRGVSKTVPRHAVYSPQAVDLLYQTKGPQMIFGDELPTTFRGFSMRYRQDSTTATGVWSYQLTEIHRLGTLLYLGMIKKMNTGGTASIVGH